MLGGSGQTFQVQRGTWVKAGAHHTCWQLSWVVGGAGDGRPVNPAQWSGVLSQDFLLTGVTAVLFRGLLWRDWSGVQWG